MNRPLKPLEVISRFVGEDINAHEDMVALAVSDINTALCKEICLGTPGDLRTVSLDFKKITQAAFLEVVLMCRQEGWDVSYSQNLIYRWAHIEIEISCNCPT